MKRSVKLSAALLWLIVSLPPCLDATGGMAQPELPNTSRENWVWRNPSPTGANLESVIYGGGRYVAVGEGGTVMISTDSIVWETQLRATLASLRSVAHGGGVFVAVGDSGTVSRSADGTNWTSQVLAAETHFQAVTYGPHGFVALGVTGTGWRETETWTSVDGRTWIAKPQRVAVPLNGLLFYANDRVAAFGDSGEVWTSKAGGDWARSATAGTNALFAGVVADDVLVLIGAGGQFWRTADPMESNWTAGRLGYGEWIYGLAHGDNTFVAVGAGGRILTSEDGRTWTRRAAGRSENLRGVAFGPAGFVAVGDRGAILTSTEGSSWRSRRTGVTDWLSDVTSGAGVYVTVGASVAPPSYASRGVILSSTNGSDWTRTGTPAAEIYAVTHGNGTFVAVGGVWDGSAYRGVALTSTDGKAWVQRNVGLSLALFSVAHGDGVFVALPDTMGVVGTTTAVVSTNGVSWSRHPIGILREFSGIVFGGGRFVAVGEGGAWAMSTNGVAWTTGNTGAHEYLWDVAYGAGQFVAVGNAGAVLTSEDGRAWTPTSSGTEQALFNIEFAGDRFAIVGGRGTVLLSVDARSWQISQSGTEQRLTGVTTGPEGMVVVGDHGVILQSAPLESSSFGDARIETRPVRNRHPMELRVPGVASGDAQHTVTDVHPIAGGGIELGLKGGVPAGFSPYYDLYPVDVSDDLRTWHPLGAVLRTNSLSTIPRLVDPAASGQPARFYRTGAGAFPVAVLPPTGPYPVGRVIREISHATHPFRHRLMMSIWYPAEAIAGWRPAWYFDSTSAALVASAYGGTAAVFEGMHTHAVAEAPLAATAGALPVVLAAPASGNPRTDSTDKAEDLASHGFVVVAVDTWDSVATQYADQEVVVGDHWAPYESQAEGRVADLRRVLEVLGSMNESDDRFAGRLELSRFGAFGFSFGGRTAFGAWEQDPRCAAALLLDGVPSSTWNGSGPGKALMAICGDDSQPIVAPHRTRLLEIVNSLERSAYWLRIRGSSHGEFGDYSWFQNRSRLRTAVLLRRYTVSFFRKHLQGADDPFLDGAPAEYPEVQGFVTRGN